MASDHFPEPIEQALDSGETTLKNAASVLEGFDAAIDRNKAIIASLDESLDRARRAIERADEV